MISPLRKFVRRTPAERWLFGRALAAVAAARVALLLLPLPAVRRLVWYFTRGRSPLVQHDRLSERHVIWAVEAAGRYSPVGSTCLATALVGQAILARHGYPAQLCVGVKRDPAGAFAAHAWLERDGEVIVGGPVSLVRTYTPLPTLEHLIS